MKLIVLVALDMVKVFANTFVVVRELDENTLRKDALRVESITIVPAT